MDAFDGVTPVLDLDYSYDLAGNITDIDDIGGGSRGRNYAYDPLYRLTQGQELTPGGASVALQSDYTYDAVGNRLTRNAGGALETLVYDAFSNKLDTVTAGAITRSLGYSDSGNTDSDDDGLGTVLTKLYDSTDRLEEVKQGVTTVATYLHNAQGQRVAKTIATTTTHYIYDMGGNLIAEHDGGTGLATAEYIALEEMPLAFITTSGIYWVHGDHLGTPQVLTAAAGTVAWDANYRPFGEATVTGALTFNLRFPGQYLDAETGLHYNYFRDYDARLGRYIQSDPIGLSGGWNTYAYVGGNPVMLTDPEGLNPGMGGGTESCDYYAERCAQSEGNSVYYCNIAPTACNNTPPSPWTSCVRKCLQDFDKACGRNSDGTPDLECVRVAHVHCWKKCPSPAPCEK